MGEAGENEYEWVFQNNEDSLEFKVQNLLLERYNYDSSDYQLVDKYIEIVEESKRKNLLNLLLKALENNNLDDIKYSLDKINEEMNLISLRVESKRKKEADEGVLIEKEIDSFNTMLSTQNIRIIVQPNGVKIHANKNGINIGYMRLINRIEEDFIITIDLIKRLNNGEKGIGEIMLKWLIIEAYRNGNKPIAFTAVPNTNSNVNISKDPLRLFKYYENIGFKRASNSANNKSIDYVGDPRELLLKFSISKHKANVAAVGGNYRTITYKKHRKLSQKKSLSRRKRKGF